MTRTKEHKTLYVVLGLGAVATFFGHGMWAVRGKDTFVGLVTGTLDNVFGATMSVGTATDLVKAIGGFDVVVSALMVALIVGAIIERGALYRLAYSTAALAVWGWATFWGFATAFARMTGAGEFYPEVWDWVERAPNFVLPVALIYIVRRHRTLNVPTHVPREQALTSV